MLKKKKFILKEDWCLKGKVNIGAFLMHLIYGPDKHNPESKGMSNYEATKYFKLLLLKYTLLYVQSQHFYSYICSGKLVTLKSLTVEV